MVRNNLVPALGEIAVLLVLTLSHVAISLIAIVAGFVAAVHHTDCGIIPCYLNVTEDELNKMAIMDPYRAVRIDVDALKANANLPAAIMVSGVVYDVANGKIEITVPPARLRDEQAP
ncbi:hypothetical protein L6654_06585 [Bradyrhizobium sp. WYCCWR 13023]|uniref:Carbonic anhydrase n=1 Tax=Bradyrhizobium zhengyangense TaxID=2911009 RepID=A0A9X1R8P7_9BRAD|nr:MULTISPECIES: hypothetical protein [Bradyrhizobium]MCG2626289.1 hypothetical protein [Bradyrhizobium zhengyangense]MCG2644699.1 hypothetical protein [Bradyrhizobium zhengyangense]MCG2668297.1 hypothetical protein [Bradyrhizobium zhengyangense]